MKRKYIYLLIFFFLSLFAEEVKLNKEELIYLKNNSILLGVDNNYAPMNFINEANNIDGMSIDFINLLSKKINKKIDLKAASWTKVLDEAMSHKIDGLINANQTSKREKKLNFTKPYLVIPYGFITEEKTEKITNINKLKDKLVIVRKKTVEEEILKKRYPNINLIVVETYNDALALLSSKKAHGIFAHLPIIVHNMEKHLYTNLKINFVHFDKEIGLQRIAVNNENPVLLSILNKAINSIKKEEKQKIINKWIGIHKNQDFDFQVLLKVLFFVFIIAIISLVFNYILNKKVQKKTKELQKLNEDLEEQVQIRTKEQASLLTLFDTGDSVLFKWNNDEGWNVSYVSKSVKRLLGYSQKDFLEAKISYISCIHKDDLDFVIKEVKDASKKNKKHYQHKPYRLVTKTKEVKWVLDYTVILRNENNEITDYLGYIIDISQEKEHEKLILEQSKLASMGEMINNIAHQWRQPLSVISSGSSGMKVQKMCGILSDDEFIKTCDLINDNAQYLSKTIDDFRNYIKGGREKSKFNLSSNIEHFLHLVASSIKNQEIKVFTDFQKDIQIESYENELIQCYINIFNNAKDAMNDKEEEKLIFISTKLENSSDNSVSICIQDNAGGIDENILPNIFEPYTTTKHKSQGTGLGLHMTYELIVNGMNGSLKVENVAYEYKEKKYKGAKFLITLPLK